MKLLGILAVSAVVGSFFIGAADAQIREQQPAEFPPASYKGKQYVDSSGCVFIRAGIDGDVSWVPRVTRNRKTVCGFQPSLGTSVAAATPAAPAPRSAPAQITLDSAPAAAPAPRATRTAAVATRPAAPAPRATRTAVAAPRPAEPVVVRQTAPKRRVVVASAPKPAPRVVVAQAPVAVAAPAPVARQAVTSCPGASAISQRYLQASSGVAVRCGPQAEAITAAKAPSNVQPVTVASQPRRVAVAAAPQSAANLTSTTRIAPKHVVTNRINTQNVTVPHGYKKVWSDGRLNPKRAEQNLQGRQDMLLIWTQTLPRRLINQHTGRDVTASVPLVYPYTSVAQQRQALGEVTIVQRDGQTMKRVVRHNRAAPAAPVARKPVYSTRSAPAKPKAKAPARTAAVQGKRYVQIGTFRNSANAQQAAQQVARMGMPARIGKHRKGSNRYMTVQAGPFGGPSAMQSALKRLRSAGYRDAFPRN